MKQYIYVVSTKSVDVVDQLMDDNSYYFTTRKKAEQKFEKVLKELIEETEFFINEDYLECRKYETNCLHDRHILRRFSMYYKFDVRKQSQRESYEVLMNFDSMPVCHMVDCSDKDNINYFLDDNIFSGEREQLALDVTLTKEEIDEEIGDTNAESGDQRSVNVEPKVPIKAEKSSVAKTPLIKQYEEMKKKHPDAVLLFRVGDFYETFGEDAIATSEILGITLTRRTNGKAKSIELAGFPHHALDSYLPKLVRVGKRVAICEQLDDAKKKGKSEVNVIEDIKPPL